MDNLSEMIETIYSNPTTKNHFIRNAKRISLDSQVTIRIADEDTCGILNMNSCGSCNFGSQSKIAGFNPITG